MGLMARVLGITAILCASVAWADESIQVVPNPTAQVVFQGKPMTLTRTMVLVFKPGDGLCVDRGSVSLVRRNVPQPKVLHKGECFFAQPLTLAQSVYQFILSLRRNPRTFDGVQAQSRGWDCRSQEGPRIHVPVNKGLTELLFPVGGRPDRTLRLLDNTGQILFEEINTGSRPYLSLPITSVRSASRLAVYDGLGNQTHGAEIYLVDLGFDIPEDPEQAARIFLSFGLLDYATVSYSYTVKARLNSESELLSNLIRSYFACLSSSR